MPDKDVPLNVATTGAVGTPASIAITIGASSAEPGIVWETETVWPSASAVSGTNENTPVASIVSDASAAPSPSKSMEIVAPGSPVPEISLALLDVKANDWGVLSPGAGPVTGAAASSLPPPARPTPPPTAPTPPIIPARAPVERPPDVVARLDTAAKTNELLGATAKVGADDAAVTPNAVEL